MMEPTIVCELEAGSPKYHVPRFQIMAAINRANTMAKPAPLPTCRINSTGSSVMMVNATAPVETRTPIKFHVPDQTTAIVRLHGVRIDDGCNGIGSIVKAIHKLKTERDQQGDAQQEVRVDRGALFYLQVSGEADDGVNETND